MPLANAAKEVMNDALGDIVAYLSLHDGAPGGSGANEISGGSPAYARLAVTWDPASGNTIEIADAVGPFNVPASTTVMHIGLWSADSGGTFYGSAPVTNEVFGAQGEYTVTAGSHTLTDPA